MNSWNIGQDADEPQAKKPKVTKAIVMESDDDEEAPKIKKTVAPSKKATVSAPAPKQAAKPAKVCNCQCVINLC